MILHTPSPPALKSSPFSEAVNDPREQAIVLTAKEMVEMRERWLNPDGLNQAARTFTTFARLTCLDLAYWKLNSAVFAAYGWPADLNDEQILERLLALNL